MKLFLGVDGGQSSTVALIADANGRVLGAGHGGPCNHVAADEGRVKFNRAMSESIGMALANLGIEQPEFEAACLGFSGGFADKETYSRDLIRSKAFKITHDAEIALTGATGGRPGIIVIAGTGSIAFGKNAEGLTGRAGGWGYIFGDEGGAFDLVRKALRAALAMEEGWGESTDLRRCLLEAASAQSANELMHRWYNGFNRAAIAKFAPIVDAAAQAGDAVAMGILSLAGEQLCQLVCHVFGQLFQPADLVAISYIGGVFESKTLGQQLERSIKQYLKCSVRPPLFPPAAGALIEALKMAGINTLPSDVPLIKD